MADLVQAKVVNIVEKSMLVLKQSPLTSFLITITLVAPLSVSMLASSYTYSLLLTLTDLPEQVFQASFHQWLVFIVVELLCSLYLLFVTTSCLLSIVFMIKFVAASRSTSNPVSLCSIVYSSTAASTINSGCLWDGFILTLAIALCTCFIPVTVVADYSYHQLSLRLLCTLFIQFIFLLPVLLCIWELKRGNLFGTFNLTIRGVHTIHTCGDIVCKSCDCKNNTALFCVFSLLLYGFTAWYVLIYMTINGVFATVIVLYPEAYSMFTRTVTSLLLVGLLLILNWITLLFFSVKPYDDVTESSVNNQQ